MQLAMSVLQKTENINDKIQISAVGKINFLLPDACFLRRIAEIITKKMERVTGVDKERSDEEPELSEGNRLFCEQSDFFQTCKKQLLTLANF